jgi:hypothetical protein
MTATAARALALPPPAGAAPGTAAAPPPERFLARAANRFFPAAWAKGWLPPPDLEETTLLEQAARVARSTDFGGDDFLPALRILLPALREEAGLTPLGRVIAHGSALKVLIERAQVAQLLKAEPAIATRPLAPPLVIAGPMRSGTTRLHRLLAQDPRFVHLRFFEATFPVPPAPGATDWRPRKAGALLAFLRRLNPALDAIHPTAPFEPDEELGLFEHSFWGAQLEAQRPIPSFARWCEAADPGPAYRWLGVLLRLIGHARGDPPQRPWLLKTPQHLAHLAGLDRAFPGARILVTHRDPQAVVASGASLAFHQMSIQVERPDPHWAGREWLHKTASRIAAMERDRAALPAGQLLDIHFAEMNADWAGELARIYRWLDMDWPPAVRAAQARWLAGEARRPRHRAHRYRLADFGLTSGQVEEQLGGYRAAFAIPFERA